MASFQTREEYLVAAIDALDRRVFRFAGATVPQNVRVSCGWPYRGGIRVIGQAWCRRASGDNTFEIFISPRLDEPLSVLAVLAHELVHVSVGIEHGHRGPFKRLALAIGLEGRMTATVPGERFRLIAHAIHSELGAYPHRALDKAAILKPGGLPDGGEPPLSTAPRAQKARLIKATCGRCGFTLRLTRRWISGRTPCCPDPECDGHDTRMVLGAS